MLVRKAFMAFIACSVALCSLVFAQGGEKQVVKIGFAGGLGKLTQSNLSFSARDGALMAIDEANQRQIVIGGRRIEFQLLMTDDQSDVNFARIAAKSLVTAGVVGVIGHNTTDTSVAVSSIYSEAGIAMISPTSTGRKFTQQRYRTSFQLLGNSDVTAAYLAQLSVQTLKATRIVAVDNDTALGIGMVDAYLKQIGRDGGAVLFRESVASKTSDFNAVLSRAKQEKADLVFFAGVGPQARAFSQNFQRVGVGATLLLTGGGVNLEFPQAGPYPEGVYVLLHGLPVDTRPGYATFEKNYHKKYDSSLTAYAMFSYDAVGMLIEALRKNNSLNPRAAVETLHSMQYKGISGPISFGADGSQNNPPYSLYKVVQKNWVLVKTYGG